MKFIYAIYDLVAQEYVGMRMYLLMVFRTDHEAARYFSDAINDPKSILNRHPKDYHLLKLGYIDNDRYIRSTDDHELIATGDQLIVATPQLDMLDDDADINTGRTLNAKR